MTRVFLVDDHEIVRRGIADLIARADDLEVVGESDSVGRTMPRVRATRPDVVVVDLRLPDGNGVELCRAIRSDLPGTRCLILTAHDDDEAYVNAVLAGASGYLLKSVRSQDILGSIRRVAAGENLLSATATQRVVTSLQRADRSTGDPPELTLRERQVLTLIADGLTNRQIGDRLGLAEKTVKNYASGLFAKLGIERRTQAAVYGLSRTQEPRPGHTAASLWSTQGRDPGGFRPY
ncbi:DNA-binding response regulator [Tersicoccus solisilvae]|uniref:DNA-binding response regulator n=1 Tax=Tersicoccus solisilvae TaxID=1882339 RepID=A0ABQ1P1A2_9MICC|nr:response regulator transcription factor [Tersicoccus solisilvae]GGC89110.1 DNA-binding response regulator [Tersicoccus solisilvae]